MQKRLLLLSLLCLLAVSCDTLKLIKYPIPPDGAKLYATSNVNLFEEDGDEFLTALGMKPIEKDTLVAVSISTYKMTESAMFGKGNTVTISFEDGSVIVWKNVLDSYMEVENNVVLKGKPVHGMAYNYYYSPWVGITYAVPYQVAGYVPSPSIEKTTSSYALYIVSTEQIRAVSNKVITGFELQAGKHKYKMKNPETASGIYSQLYGFLVEKLKK